MTDAASQIVSLISFRIAAKPADRDHPYGHARIEYVASMIVSMSILIIAYQLLGDSIDKILHPVATEFRYGVILGAVVVQAADQVEIDHRDIIQGANLKDRVTEIPEGVAVDIRLALIPIPGRGYGIIPGGDDRRHEVELRVFQRFCPAQLHDPLAPHMRGAVNG